jgi:hypothetical protein
MIQLPPKKKSSSNVLSPDKSGNSFTDSDYEDPHENLHKQIFAAKLEQQQ